ncbi:MAG: hypothetical protein HY365_03895 [Candidatus Aenigmarchaeota archaeon]|nr:hypothetical protein [Candidatus Aenigmarchaeota archaeon]
MELTTPLSLEQMEAHLRMKLDEWQKEFILAEEPYLILKMGRKCGKSKALAFKIAYDCLNKDFSGSDGICIISKGMRLAKELFLDVRSILQACGIKFVARAPEEDEAYSSLSQMILPNGNKVYALPCGYDGVTIRYYSFWKMVRDEDAFIPDAVDAAVSACLAVHGAQEIRASTPFGTHGSFYRAWHDPAFRRWERKTRECGRVTREWLAYQKKRLTKAEFQQEFEAEFTEIAEGIYRSAIIAMCSRSDINWQDVTKKCILFLGVDFARFGEDENCIAYNWYDPEAGISYIKIKTIHSKFRTTQIAGAVQYIAQHEPKFRMVVTDDAGIGAGPTDILIEKLGKRKVIGVSNHKRIKRVEGERSKYMKTDLHAHLIKLMENGKVVFEDDVEIVRSLLEMRYKYTAQGDLTIFGRNNHAAEAIVRAVFPTRLRHHHMSPWIETIKHDEAQVF